MISSKPISFKNHFVILDILKTFAVQLIIFHHISNYGEISRDAQALLPGIMYWISNYGNLAVQIFLVTGGYLAAKNLPISMLKVGFIKAIHNRYLRLIPTYVVALLLTMLCAIIARYYNFEEYIGLPETWQQFLAHIFFLQHIFGFESISVGVWYVAIDWQLYVFLAFFILIFKNFKTGIWFLGAVVLCSLLFFSKSFIFDNYFIYFLGAYGLGIISYLSNDAKDQLLKTHSKLILLIVFFAVLSETFFELHIKNILEILIALVISWGGSLSYDHLNPKWAQVNIWFSQRSYCAFLIHFCFILLMNTLYTMTAPHLTLSPVLFILGIWVMSWIAAHYLYKYIEFPSRKIQLN